MSTASYHYGGTAPLSPETLAMSRDEDRAVARLQRASQRVLAARDETAAARLELRAAIRSAFDAGLSLSAIGRELGISRQRVKVLRDEEA